jgi:hypothetical protein
MPEDHELFVAKIAKFRVYAPAQGLSLEVWIIVRAT